MKPKIFNNKNLQVNSYKMSTNKLLFDQPPKAQKYNDSATLKYMPFLVGAVSVIFSIQKQKINWQPLRYETFNVTYLNC